MFINELSIIGESLCFNFNSQLDDEKREEGDKMIYIIISLQRQTVFLRNNNNNNNKSSTFFQFAFKNDRENKREEEL
jgi:hypothetical protein